MRSAIGSFSGDDDEIGWDYEFQSALSEAIEHAMDADGEASRPIYIEIDGRIFKAQRVAVDRDGDDTCEITIHAKPL